LRYAPRCSRRPAPALITEAPGAEAADHKALRLISTEVPIDLRALNNLEDLVLAETKDQWNWEMLASVEKKIGDPQLKSIVSRAVREVRKQEKSHLNWNEHALTSLAMKAAMKTEPAVTDASVRASHGQDRLRRSDGHTKQRAAARKSIKKAAEARGKETTAKLPKSVRTKLVKKAQLPHEKSAR
jgi:rubrerythrin